MTPAQASTLARNIGRATRKPKFGNRVTMVGDLRFDSAKEARRWGELQLLARAGKIRSLQRQVRIPLTVNGHVVGHMVCDFEYFDNEKDHVVWEDTKSAATRKLPVFRLKAKLIKAIYGREIVET